MNEVPPGAIALIAASSVEVFQSPSPPKPYPSDISRWTARPGSCRRPPRSSKFVVNPPNPPSTRKALSPGFGDPLVAPLVDDRHEVVHPVRVDRDPEAKLGLHLVALGDGDVTHV